MATGGKVSEALAAAGGSALGGACAGHAGALLLLGRAGLRRVAARAAHAAAHHHADMGRWAQAVDTLANEYKVCFFNYFLLFELKVIDKQTYSYLRVNARSA